MAIPILLIGTAPDGPDSTIVPLDGAGLSTLESLFFPPAYETFTVSGSASGATLALAPWGGEAQFLAPDPRNLTKLAPYALYEPRVQDTALTFGPNGSDILLTVRYRTAPRESDLLPAFGLIAERYGPPAVYRLPAARATLAADPLTLLARYGGARYNGILATVAPSGVTLTIPNSLSATLGATAVYPASGASDLGELAEQIDRDCARGVHPVQARAAVPSDPLSNLPTLTGALAGGDDGTLDAAAISALVDTLDLEGVEIVCFCGGTDSGMRQAVIDLLEANDYPSLAIVGSPLSQAALPVSGYVDALLVETLSTKHGQLFLVPGWTGWQPSAARSAQVSLAPVFAAQWAAAPGVPTHQPAALTQLLPAFDEAQIHSLAGLCCPYTRSIQNGICPWWSGPTDGTDAPYAKLLQSVSSRVRTALRPLLGHPVPDLATAEELVGGALDGLSGVRALSFRVVIAGDRSDKLQVTIELTRYGEVRAIELHVTV